MPTPPVRKQPPGQSATGSESAPFLSSEAAPIAETAPASAAASVKTIPRPLSMDTDGIDPWSEAPVTSDVVPSGPSTYEVSPTNVAGPPGYSQGGAGQVRFAPGLGNATQPPAAVSYGAPQGSSMEPAEPPGGAYGGSQGSSMPVAFKKPGAATPGANGKSLRPARDPVEMRFNGDLVMLKKGWLIGKNVTEYRKGVKQGLLIAAAQIELEDLKQNVDVSAAEVAPVRQRMQSLLSGTAAFDIPSHGKTQPMTQLAEPDDSGLPPPGKRHMLVKYGFRTKMRKVRQFAIHGGQLVVFKSGEPNAPPRKYYGLSAAEYVVEQRTSSKQIPPFEGGFDWRIRMAFREREAGPVLLYAEDQLQMELWLRVIKLARFTNSSTEKAALQMCFRRLMSTVWQKGWDALALYTQDLFDTKALIWQLAMRILRSDQSRSWNKCKLVYQKRMEHFRMKDEKKTWAAQFLLTTLKTLAKAQLRPLNEVRDGLITKVQNDFRKFKNVKLSENSYAIGLSCKTRTQQAKQGIDVGIAYNAVTAGEALLLTVEPEILKVKEEWPSCFETLKSTYTESSMPAPRVSHIHASDCLSMLLFSDDAAGGDFAGLTKASWLQFVSLNRISAVVLNSARVEGPYTGPQSPEMMRLQEGLKRAGQQVDKTLGAAASPLLSSCWITLLGPRLCWGRQLQRPAPTDEDQAPSVAGAADGLAIADGLLQGNKLHWLRFFCSVKGATLPSPPPDGTQPEAAPPPQETRCIVHLLGRKFISVMRSGDEVDYSFTLDVSVPVLEDKIALAALDDSELCVDIVKESLPWTSGGSQQVIWQARVKLWRLLAPGLQMQGPSAARYSLSTTFADGKVQVGRRLPLVAPESPEPENGESLACINIDIMAEIRSPQSSGRGSLAEVVSPELRGVGPLASMYSSHRGAWYDPQLGPGQFQADHVANFIEFSLGTLRFPPVTSLPSTKFFSYVVEVRCVGASVVSPLLHKPLQAWTKVCPIDGEQIAFRGAKLVLPLPPGFWSSSQRPPQVFVSVLCREQKDTGFVSLADLSSINGKQSSKEEVFKVEYHATLNFAGLALNAPWSGIPVLMGSVIKPPTTVNLDLGQTSGGTLHDSAVLGMEVTLRDRDYVWAAAGELCSGAHPCPLCIGERVMLSVEESVTYPRSELDLKRTLSPTTWDPKNAGKFWGMPLRDPNLVHEFESSGLQALPEYEGWRTRNIPRLFQRVCPYKFILPPCERTFQQQRLPGVFRRILKDLSDSGGAVCTNSPAGMIVQRLTHLSSQAPCTLLAVHADSTCDLEVSPDFIANWEANPYLRYAIPGLVQAMPCAARAVGGDKTVTKRLVLRGVPTVLVSPCHTTGFNVYDAAVADVDAVVALDPTLRLGEFDVSRPPGPIERLKWGAFGATAGPMPVDANPAVCAYEWSLHLSFPTEQDTYHFVDMLRQCTRLDHQLHARQLVSAQRAVEQKEAADQEQSQLDLRSRSRQSGNEAQLEVLLVEARRLNPQGREVGADHLDAFLAGASPGEQLGSLFADTDLNTHVTFKLLSSSEPGAEAMVCRTTKIQNSPTIYATDSPDWSKMEGVGSIGGFSFKTGTINTELYPDMVMELEVRSEGIAIEYPIGAIQLPVSKNNFLTDPENPFRNLWLPLTSETLDGTGRALNPSGEVHIMTFWSGLPPDAGDERRAPRPKNARAYLLAEIAKKVAGARLREPIHDLQVPLVGYNPNNARGLTWPMRRSDELAVRIEGCLGAAPYLECCEQRQFHAWRAFRAQLKEDGIQQARLGELRLVWLQQTDDLAGAQQARQLQALVGQGVPSSLRSWVWPQMTLSSRVQSKSRPEAYQLLLEAGQRVYTPAFDQLSEDLLLATEWESLQIPTVLQQHRLRLESARNVCTALIVFSLDRTRDSQFITNLPSYRDEREGRRCTGTAITYSESLFILCFYLLLPQSARTEETTRKPKSIPEDTVFWLLFTLIASRTNGAYKDYFATSGTLGAEQPTDSPNRIICPKSGAMEDVFLLQCALVVHEPELWVRMGALGFQLAGLFYGAFMRLYARVLPTSSLYRLWDFLFADSTNPQAFPHARHGLIDLAFGMLRSSRVDLLLCQSALEVHEFIEAFFASLHDPQSVIELIESAGALLWGGVSRKQVLKLWRDGTKEFERYHEPFERQNDLLKQLGHVASIDPSSRFLQSPIKDQGFANSFKPGESGGYGMLNTAGMRSGQTGMLNSSGTGLLSAMEMVEPAEPGVNTKDLSNSIIKTFLQLFPSSMSPSAPASVMRPVPSWMLDFGPPVVEDSMHKYLRMVGATSAAEAVADAHFREAQEVEALPKNQAIPCPPGSRPEPDGVTDVDWANEVGHNMPGWSPFAKPLYDAFVDPTDRRFSLYEFLIGIICCSKGTAGEKAGALFDLLVSPKSALLPSVAQLWNHTQHHWVPIAQAAKAVIQRTSTEKTADQSAPPAKDCRKDAALHFKIWSDSLVGKTTLLAEVVVPNVGPFVASADQEVPCSWFSMWSPPEEPPDKAAETFEEQEKMLSLEFTNGRTCLGEVDMAIKWVPNSDSEPERGQLHVRLVAIKFFPTVSNPQSKHPWMTVVTYSSQLIEQKIPSQKNAGAMHAGAGEFMEFHAPSRLAKSLHFTGVGDSGWNQTSQEWRWNSTLGEQRSNTNLTLQRVKVIEAGSTLPMIDIWGVRIIVQGILGRSLQYVTNRQAVLLADAYFSRGRAVPAILDALLVPGDTVGEFSSVAELKEVYRSQGTEAVDVTYQLLLEAERQACQTGGILDIWRASLKEANTSLKSLKIEDPWPGQKKVLWVRYSRAGKADRHRGTLVFDENGEMVSKTELHLEADGLEGTSDAFAMGHPETTLSKEEFISCLLACPTVAEPLRRMTSADHAARLPRPLVLDVTLFSGDNRFGGGSPLEQEEAAMEDLFARVKIWVLLEIWNPSQIPGKGPSFLGETWMPALESLSSAPRIQALTLQRYAEGPTTTRPSARKEKEQQDAECPSVGVLHLAASWQLQKQEPGAARGGTLEGTLAFTLLRAEELLPRSFGHQIPGMRHELPVYVTGYAWNEVASSWEMTQAASTITKQMASMHGTSSDSERQLFKSKNSPMSVQAMPPSGEKRGGAEWQEQHQVLIGGKESIDRESKEDIDKSDVQLSNQVKVCFGVREEWDRVMETSASGERRRENDQGRSLLMNEQMAMQQDPPWNHQVEAYGRDTIGDFMQKLASASGQLATRREKRTDSASKSAAQRYRDQRSVATPQVLMVYAPGNDRANMLRPWTFDEYRRLCVGAMVDMDHWRPLDPARTFEQYATQFPFCGPPGTLPPLLRVEEAGEQLCAKSHHYRRFLHEQEFSSNLEDLNTDRQCFGYACYLHKNDGNSPEWRPCIARAEGGGVRSYSVSWAFTPNLSSAPYNSGRDQNYDEGSVLLAPREPEILDSSVPEHQELLAGAQDLRATGKSDHEIATSLHALLEQKMQSQAAILGGSGMMRRPPPITAGVVRSHLQRIETRQRSLGSWREGPAPM